MIPQLVEPIMADDGSGQDITIPSFLLEVVLHHCSEVFTELLFTHLRWCCSDCLILACCTFFATFREMIVRLSKNTYKMDNLLRLVVIHPFVHILQKAETTFLCVLYAMSLEWWFSVPYPCTYRHNNILIG